MYAALKSFKGNWDDWDKWKTLSRLYERFYDGVNYPNVADHAARGALVFGDTTGFGYLDNFKRTETWCCSGDSLTAYAAFNSESFINMEISAQLLTAWELWKENITVDLASLRSELDKLRLQSAQDSSCSGLPYYVGQHEFDEACSLPILDSTAWRLFAYWKFNPFAPSQQAPGPRDTGCFNKLTMKGQAQGFPRFFAVGSDFRQFPQEINDGDHKDIVIQFISYDSLFAVPLTLKIGTVARGDFTRVQIALDDGDHCLSDYEPSGIYPITNTSTTVQMGGTPGISSGHLYQLVLTGISGWAVFDWLQLETSDKVLWRLGCANGTCTEFDNDGFVYRCGNSSTPCPTPLPHINILPLLLNDVRLSWSHDPAYLRYDVWHDNTPYFTPNGAPLEQIGAAPWQCDHTNVRNDPTANHYYVVEGVAGGRDQNKHLTR